MTGKRCIIVVALLVLMAGAPALAEEGGDKLALKRAAIDSMATQTVKRLLAESERARELADHAVAYAVFDAFEAAFILSGGGGVGVAVDDRTGERTYMKMGTGGIGLGVGGHSFQLVFLFDSTDAFRRFVSKGWQADTAANLAAGTAGKNTASTFHQGVAVFQLTTKGLIAQANISGTKYWKARKLNR